MEPKIRIGGEEIVIPELNFKQLKKIHPLMKLMETHQKEGNEEGVMDDVSRFLEIILLRSAKPMTADEIDEALTASELVAAQQSIGPILEVNGLRAPTSGEAAPAEQAAAVASTGTSTQ